MSLKTEDQIRNEAGITLGFIEGSVKPAHFRRRDISDLNVIEIIKKD